MLHNIHLKELPADGKFFDGEIRTDVFALTGPDDPRFVPPVAFALTVRLDGPDVVIEGSLRARFELKCVRCGEWFPFELALDPYFSQEPREGAPTLDLTARMREDILLALPGHPRCEESNVEPRDCPAAGRFAPESEYTPLSAEETRELRHSNVWEALESIDPGRSKSRPKS